MADLLEKINQRLDKTSDNPPCVNPGHLFLGTPKDNMIDKVNKGRHLWGEKVGTSTLSDSQVFEIYKLREEGLRVNIIAAQFDVTPAHISDIVGGRARKRNYTDYHNKSR